MAERYQRKKFFINKRLQIRYMISMLIPMLVLILFIGLVMYYSQNKFITATTKEIGRELKDVVINNNMYIEDETTRDKKTIEELKDRFDRYKTGEVTFSSSGAVYKILFLGLLVVIIELGFLTIFISHKVAGPIYRLAKFAEGLREGDLTTRIYLRKGDELVEVASDFNQTGDFLRDTFKKMMDLNDQALAAARKAGVTAEMGLIEKEMQGIRSRIKLG